MSLKISQATIDQKVIPKDDKFYTGTLVGIGKVSFAPDQYLIGYKREEKRHPDSVEMKRFSDWN